MIDIDDVAEPAGWFLSILGALVMGVSVGLGLASYTTAKRFGCAVDPGWAGLVNVTAACGDVLGAWGTMTMLAAGGGAVAFGCGVVAMIYGKRQNGQRDA
jgi:hypothetical protein